MDRLTIPEYELLTEAMNYRWIDADYRNHLQAYLNFAVKAEKQVSKKKRKPVYTKFTQFYDYEKELSKLKKKDDEKGRFAGIGKFLKKRE